jgi:hypothetical protein
MSSVPWGAPTRSRPRKSAARFCHQAGQSPGQQAPSWAGFADGVGLRSPRWGIHRMRTACLGNLSHASFRRRSRGPPGRVRGAKRSPIARGLSAVVHALDMQAVGPPGRVPLCCRALRAYTARHVRAAPRENGGRSHRLRGTLYVLCTFEESYEIGFTSKGSYMVAICTPLVEISAPMVATCNAMSSYQIEMYVYEWN